MEWNVQQLQQARFEPIHFEQTIEVEDGLTEHQDVRAASPIQINGTVTAKRNVYSFSFTLKGELTLPCSRTLADVVWPYELKEEAHFVPEGEVPPPELEVEDTYTYTGEKIDLLPVMKERIFVNIPIQVFADNPSDVQAPPSGNGWELVTDKEKKERIDPRLADLAKFFDKE